MSIPFQLTNPSGDILRGDLHLPPRSKGQKHPLVVICHGFKGFKDWGFYPFLAESISQAGLAAIRFNFSHNGIGEEPEVFSRLDLFAKDSFGKQIEDLRAVLDAVVKGSIPHSERIDPERIGLIGHSRGAVPVLLVGGKTPNVKVLVTWAGISTCDRWSQEVKETWRREGQLMVTNSRTGQEMPVNVSILEEYEAHAGEYDLLAATRGLRIPYLVVHGDEDETVPFEEATALHDNTPRGLRKLQIIPGAGHTFGAVHPLKETPEALQEAIRVTLDWLQTRM